MNFLHYEVSTQSGDVIQVILTGNAANVLVMDDSDFRNYLSGRQFRYFGGYYTRSPIIIRPPTSGKWNVVVDLGGRAGRVNAAVRVIRGI